jgi:hypothetical protein
MLRKGSGFTLYLFLPDGQKKDAAANAKYSRTPLKINHECSQSLTQDAAVLSKAPVTLNLFQGLLLIDKIRC